MLSVEEKMILKNLIITLKKLISKELQIMEPYYIKYTVII